MTLQRLSFSVVAEQQLFLGAGPQVGNRRMSEAWVTGATLRGALAQLWLFEFGTPDQRFHELFDGSLRWPALLPRHTVLVPMSVRRCKYRPEPGCRTVAVDQFDPEAKPEQNCPVCDGSLELAKGELMELGVRRVATTSRTTVSLNADETAADGELFTRDGLPAGTELAGSTVLPAALDRSLAEWLTSLTGRTIQLGGRRSVAGRARLDAVAVHPEEVRALVAGTRLALRLISPAVVLDDQGATSTTAAAFLDSTGLRGKVQPEHRRAYLRSAHLGGWNGLAGTPRPTDTGLAAGSTVVVQVTTAGGISAAELERVLQDGVGVRQSEGFGELDVSLHVWVPPPATAVAPAGTSTELTLTESAQTFVDLVGEQEPTAVEQWGRTEIARWFADRLRSAAQQVRDDRTLDRAQLASTMANDRRLRDVPVAVEDAYLAVLADTATDDRILLFASLWLDDIRFAVDQREQS